MLQPNSELPIFRFRLQIITIHQPVGAAHVCMCVHQGTQTTETKDLLNHVSQSHSNSELSTKISSTFLLSPVKAVYC